MIEIPGYSRYYFDNNLILISKKSGKPVTLFLKNKCKVKNDNEEFKNISKNTLLDLAGLSLKLPNTAKKIPKTENYFIDIEGTVYSYNHIYPAGIVVKPKVSAKGYLQVTININADSGVLRKTIEVHKLVAKTFLMEDYIEKGLCCLHLDNNKLNCKITNLAIGTYSENNKQAYTDGINPGNGLKRITDSGEIG